MAVVSSPFKVHYVTQGETERGRVFVVVPLCSWAIEARGTLAGIIAAKHPLFGCGVCKYVCLECIVYSVRLVVCLFVCVYALHCGLSDSWARMRERLLAFLSGPWAMKTFRP